MKQVSQDIRTGETRIDDVPAPVARRGQVLVQVAASLVSAGTERMVIEFARKSLLQKVRARPDLARQVIEKARREGVLTTLDAVRGRLDQPMALGYSLAGVVVQAGDGAPYRPGDRVACAGAGFASHAEFVSVPTNLVASVPEGVGDQEASFVTLGAIALHGVRLAGLELGGNAAVIGLGLLGQLTVQLLRAHGVTTIGMDVRPDRAALAKRMGAAEAVASPAELSAAVAALTNARGADAVLICADTPSDEPVALAAEVARDRGAVVAVGAVGLNLPRKAFFDKELSFRVSRSYGPGRYDPQYEEEGHDYPYGFVRWTEQRNMDAVLRLMADRRLDVGALITHRFPIADAPRALDLVTGRTQEPFLAVVLEYPDDADRRTRLAVAPPSAAASSGRVSIGVIGAGLFANATILPILKQLDGVDLRAVSAGSGLSAASAARRFGFAAACTGAGEVIDDPSISAVAILTRHSTHAGLVMRALEQGKAVFVEKPLCVTTEELDAVANVRLRLGAAGAVPPLMVGFNRRFAPFVREMREALTAVREPLMMHYRVNAGFIPSNHWTQRPEEGGRLIGEGAHFIDLLVHLARARVCRVTTRALPDGGRYTRDNFVVTLEFDNGSIGTVTYVANGSKAAGKEWLEVLGGGMAAQLDDFRRLTIHGERGSRTNRAWLRQDKGHRAEWEAFVGHLRGKAGDPMPFETIAASMAATLAAARSLETGGPVELDA